MDWDMLEPLAGKVRNWGRWGEADQRGTLNHIGPEALRRAAATVTSGKAFSLSLRFDRNGPQTGAMRANPSLYFTDLATPLDPAKPEGPAMSDDIIHMALQCSTHWDALSHVHYDGVLYNGCRASETLSLRGASKNGIEHLASPGIMSRGVLLDVARFHGREILAPDHAIPIDDLEAVAAAQNVTIEPGDIVLIRTGHIRHFTINGDRAAFNNSQAGLHPACAEWLYDKSIAAVAADNLAVETISYENFTAGVPLAMHMACLRDMGMPLGEMFNLDALAEDCATDGRYTFLLCAPPLAITGAVGSPVNPMALK